MASFQKRGKVWQYTISRVINGVSKPIRKSGFLTKKEAQVAAIEVEANLRKGIVPQLTPVPFADYFEQWLKLYKTNIMQNSYARYIVNLKIIQQSFIGVMLQSITKRSYQAFLNEYGKTHARLSSKRLNSDIRACVKEAIDERLIQVDFTRGAIISGEGSKSPEEKHLNYVDSQLLMNELYKNPLSPTHLLLLLGITSGMRFGEMLGLTRKDFDFCKNEITVNKTWGYNKHMPTGFGKTKNEQSKRTIKMDIETMKVFRNFFQHVPENIHQLVFYSPHSKYKALDNQTINLHLKKLLKNLNIEPISIHGLRHTHASILLYKKISIYYISERLGHSNIDTTLKHYAHIVKELRKEDEDNTVALLQNMVK